MPVPVLRFYVHTLSDIYGILPSAYGSPDKEIQIVLAFARDYDNEGNSTNGKFFTYIDNITPQDIRRIKEDAPAPGSIKFFLSIGGCESGFPFAVNSEAQSKTWIVNATDSLRGIILEYDIDGIDVYYEYIRPDYFPNSIAKVIDDLKGGQNSIVTKASITVSYPLRDMYLQLYGICAALLNNVVYQCFTVSRTTIPDPQHLVNVFHELFRNYPREKILAGYSDDQPDVTLNIFAHGLAQLLREDSLGISKWHGKPGP